MASKTGWTCDLTYPLDNVYDEQHCDECVPPEEGCKCVRVCVRVDEVPERMTREEMVKNIKPGWWVQTTRSAYVITVTSPHPDFNVVMSGIYWVRYEDITHTRPHDEAPWIEVTD